MSVTCLRPETSPLVWVGLGWFGLVGGVWRKEEDENVFLLLSLSLKNQKDSKLKKISLSLFILTSLAAPVDIKGPQGHRPRRERVVGHRGLPARESTNQGTFADVGGADERERRRVGVDDGEPPQRLGHFLQRIHGLGRPGPPGLFYALLPALLGLQGFLLRLAFRRGGGGLFGCLERCSSPRINSSECRLVPPFLADPQRQVQQRPLERVEPGPRREGRDHFPQGSAELLSQGVEPPRGPGPGASGLVLDLWVCSDSAGAPGGDGEVFVGRRDDGEVGEGARGEVVGERKRWRRDGGGGGRGRRRCQS